MTKSWPACAARRWHVKSRTRVGQSQTKPGEADEDQALSTLSNASACTCARDQQLNATPSRIAWMSLECRSFNPLVVVLVWPTSERSECTHACSFYPLLPPEAWFLTFDYILMFYHKTPQECFINKCASISLRFRRPEFRQNRTAVSALGSPVASLLHAASAVLEKEHGLSLLTLASSTHAEQTAVGHNRQCQPAMYSKTCRMVHRTIASHRQRTHHSKSTDAI